MISGLEDESGNWVEDKAELGRVVEEYFITLFSSNPSGADGILKGIQHSMVDDSSSLMDGEFHASEV